MLSFSLSKTLNKGGRCAPPSGRWQTHQWPLLGANCSITIRGTPERGFSSVSVYAGEDDEADLDQLSDVLCQDCLDEVCGFYEDEVNSGDEENISSTGYCLVDFEEKQLYTLSDPYRGYFIRDYRIRYDIEPETEEGRRIQIDIVYVPIRDI